MVTAQNYRISEISRFLILIGGMTASVCISTFYGFNILSNKMVELFNFSGADLTTISTVGVVVGFATFPGGMLLDYAGPLPVLVCGTVLNMVGVILYGLAFEGIITGSVVKFSVFSAIMNLGCASFDTGSLMAILGSFPLTKGPVVALMKTFAGLGALVLAVINYSFFRTAYSHYMYFMAALVVFMGSTACLFIRFPPYHLVDRERSRVPEQMQVRRRLTERAYLTQYPPMVRFYVGFFIIVSLVIYLTVQSFCVAYANPSDKARMGNTIMIIIFVFSFGLMAAPFPFLGGMEEKPSEDFPEYPENELRNDSDAYENDNEKAVLRPTEVDATQDHNALGELYVAEEEVCDEEKGGKAKKSETEDDPQNKAVVEDQVILGDENLALMMLSDQDPQYQTTFLQSVTNVDLWLCWWNTLATWGCGIVTSSNSAQIYRALADDEYETKTNTMYSAIISVASALGRMSMGIFEYVLSRYPSESRPVMTCVYPISSACMVLGLIFLLALPLKSKAIVIGFFFDSSGNGFSWACTALTVRTVFAKDSGKHYSFMYVGAFAGVIALNRFGYGELYDREAKRQRDAAVMNGTTNIYPRCAGKKCVNYSFIILLCVNATAIVGSTLFHYRYRRFVLKHRTEKAAAQAKSSNSPVEPVNVAQLH
ncbi:hypothetical protein ABB37_04734 [Leptomonas pyrrhocoris]|uniref:Nodulin-like domain-containing protein n=1 Tax=Leptomonas pyrrhocoris TaxID=157538 RepID=A0A0M9G1U9_LEPPY|nr:hypothetical protein ABB37_04734 [Leptomonas pyrrhocoris]KPA80523.1 hypothetical protein ABB37_04734 [Leptomonas pyrrhocoris]|eukprot:XP_015658962.1 hypothetical protein ABB37_04734 [Leptomonas pyrrhocoris]